MIATLEQVISSVNNSRAIEVFCKDSSSRYGYNSNLSNHNHSEIFRLMQTSSIKGLQDKIVELEKEFENL